MKNKKLNNIDKGTIGENVASNYLLQKNYAILQRNWRYKHWEVDIIALRNNKLHFVEVKTRTNRKFGNPESAVNEKKMNHLKNAAEAFLMQNPTYTNIQFDVIAILLTNNLVEEVFLIEDVYF